MSLGNHNHHSSSAVKLVNKITAQKRMKVDVKTMHIDPTWMSPVWHKIEGIAMLPIPEKPVRNFAASAQLFQKQHGKQDAT